MDQRGFRQISAFFEALSEKPTRDTLYRGHADAIWPLQPSAYRPGRSGITDRAKLHQWSRVAARFASPVPRNDIEWLVLAQHYGVPTMLLDWTESPLIALFFACYGEHYTDGCVWQVRTNSAFKHFHYHETVDPFRSERDRPGLIWATAMNARTLAQDSAMSLHCSPQDTIPDALMRQVYIVPKTEKADTLSALKVLGFTRERLFSDISMAVDAFMEDIEEN
ncbi:FRG domain-containing protein [Sphingobium yanoikuyae]|uniref:FRG domain-containing protein n=1 Tax=Sphingobium yanoikuyae TaxID=13690 RepID=UPI0026F3232B|nr:FRG domain-containing protein [Sphingobium yanoikuyae]